jgi:hypothetical protein
MSHLPMSPGKERYARLVSGADSAAAGVQGCG